MKYGWRSSTRIGKKKLVEGDKIYKNYPDSNADSQVIKESSKKIIELVKEFIQKDNYFKVLSKGMYSEKISPEDVENYKDTELG